MLSITYLRTHTRLAAVPVPLVYVKTHAKCTLAIIPAASVYTLYTFGFSFRLT